jgi:hypothetical protein
VTTLRTLIAVAACLLVGSHTASTAVRAQQRPSPPPQPAETGGGSPAPAPRRLTGDEVNGINSGGDNGVRFELRTVRPGESQALGHLTRIECVSGGAVRVYVKTDTETLVAAAPKLQAIDLRTYRGDKEFMLGCGTRPAADPVYLTWRSAAPASSPGRQAAPPARGGISTAKNVGTAVALEFLPSDFVPPTSAK